MGRCRPRLRAYTADFADARGFHDTYIYDGIYPGYTVCAKDGDRVDRYETPRVFCIEIDSDARPGRQVVGGFRASFEEHMDPYDCFGHSIWCDDD